ncbi:DsbA family protein [Actinomadura sp. 9N407]|uniref:DsbA family protein n=1 Tax=Actinomadura sp. 9N407 TaxID=3375154 RepID=UPI0037B1F141
MSTSRWERRHPAGEAGHRLLAVLGAVAVFSVTLAGFTALRGPSDTGAAVTVGSYDAPVSTVWRTEDGAVAVAGDVRSPVLEIFTDYRCPSCAELQDTAAATIKRLASQNRVRVVYRPIVLPQGEPADSQSRRAANASLCAPAGHWLAYHDALFTRGPMEGTGAFTEADLIALARYAGIRDAAFADCVSGGLQNARLDRLTRDAVEARGVREVPTAFLNGTRLDLRTHLLEPARLERAIHTAARG